MSDTSQAEFPPQSSAHESTRRQVSATQTPFSPAGQDVSPTATLESAPRIEGYQVQECIGHGGMGTVWRAWQLSTRRQVALKLLHLARAGSEKARQRFEREIELTARLEHPHIAHIYDSGIHHGVYYYAMELIDGVPLDQFVRTRRLAFRQILQLMVLICRAVEHAHQRGVIHRDLKPGNIIVDSHGEPHVLDFGLGKPFDADASLSTMTVDGDVAGTPAYMSPEQAAGDKAPIDTRSDVYSLGVILFQLLCGRLPYDTSGGSAMIIQRIVAEEMVRPRSASPAINAELEALLLKSLARRTEARYGSAAAMADDLENYLKGEPLTAHQPSKLYFVRKKLRKHRLAVGLAAATLVAVTAVTVHSGVQVARERDLALAAAHGERALRRLAELRLADGFVAWSIDLDGHLRHDDAREQLWDAYELYRKHETSPIHAALGLLYSCQEAPPPLAQWKLPAPTRPLSCRPIVHFGGNGRAASWETGDEKRVTTDLISGRSLAPQPVAPLLPGPWASLLARSSDERLSAVCRAGGNELHPQWELLLFDRGAGAAHSLGQWGHRITAVAFAPDGRKLLSIDGRNKLSYWDLSTMRFEHERDLRTGLEEIRAVVAHGADVVVGTADGTIAMFNETGQQWARRIHTAPASALAMSADGQRVASGDCRGEIRILNAATGQVLRGFRGHDGEICSLSFSDDHNLLASVGEDSQVRIWTLREVDTVLRRHESRITCLSISDDGRIAASGHADGMIELTDVATARALRRYRIPSAITFLAFGPDRTLLAASREGGAFRIDLSSDRPLMSLMLEAPLDPGARQRPQTNFSPAAAFSADGRLVLSVSIKGSVLWDAHGGEMLRIVDRRPADSACFSADGQLALVGITDRRQSLLVADTQHAAHWEIPATAHGTITALAALKSNQFALIGHRDGTMRAIDLQAKRELWKLAAHSNRIASLVLVPDGRTAISASADGNIRLWDLQTRRQLRSVHNAEGPIGAVALSSDGQLLLYAVDGTSRLLRLAEPIRLRELTSRMNDAFGNSAVHRAEWYSLLGRVDWAEQLLAEVAEAGAGVPPLPLARYRWSMGDFTGALRGFEQALADAATPAERSYLSMCRDAAARGDRWESDEEQFRGPALR